MTTITSNDTVLTSVSFEGRTIATFRATGFNSLADILKAARRAAGNIVGMIRLSILNSSRGWREERSMYVAAIRPGVQLTLF
ncbi:MAG: hypothetical protein J6C95_03230 [Muribaculaceae bacterium]|nr:hypothetical protein [Muribaculaceae bacterium]